ncbi:MAG: hypothetical protein ACE5IJ_10335, partial [Thermoplasmata archaeon]
MRRTKRWLSASALTAALVTVLSLASWSIAASQENRLQRLNHEALQLLKQGKYQEGVEVAKDAVRV